ncbi:conjugal transfer protein TraG N-terminal domain-containing protein [Geoalkalibacter subterraneus]|uniref:TraG N-terminal Proteobacteria domain-containing protein n=1 Tax=Geoalkalibacter subterraneus TaxID=483547 RepID=A0A0B5FIS7_9BACT|nr:conjugal transfer protein TraG N-terminal domain-containing protein [Geoalkalibacter subterraneus]AJF08102.1 hypothetical protein GSUB_16450 [Geoalkalibacter subterraneus]
MTMEIWSIGDAEYLASILNSVAMFVGTGAPYQLASIGMILSILAFSVQSILQGGKSVPFQNVLIGWLLFSALFGPPATVIVNDAYETAAYPVDNVPWGVAATGHVMSTMGYEVTQYMEQAFSLPTMISNGFAAPLEALLKARDLDFATASVGGNDNVNTSEVGDIETSIVNYIKDCVAVGLKREELNPKQIALSNPAWSALKYNSNVYWTKIHLPDQPPESLSCSEAYAELDSLLRSGDFWVNWDNYLSSTIDSTDPIGDMQSAINAFSLSSTNAQSFMITSILSKLYSKGISLSHAQDGDVAEAILVESARQQRNIQWAAEGSLFSTIVRPMMTFFEAFWYCLTPFMAFLAVFLPMGPKIIMKYLSLAIWIQLWMPTMAVLNYYINWTVQRKFEQLGQTYALDSFDGFYLASTMLQDQLAVAGKLASATPVLTMVLLGSTYAAVSLSGQLSGGDHVNEKAVAPDPVNTGAGLNVDSAFSHNRVSGSRFTGAKDLAGSFDIGQNLQQSVSSAQSAVSSSTMNFGQSLGRSISSEFGQSDSLSNTQGLHQRLSASSSQTDQTMAKWGADLTKELGLGQQHQDVVTGSLLANLKAGGGPGDLGKILGAQLSGSVSASIGNQFSESGIASAMDRVAGTEGHQGSQAFMAQLAESVDKDSGSQATSTVMGGEKVSDNENLTESAQKVLSAQDSYEQATSHQTAFGGRSSVDAVTLGHQATSNPQLMEEMRSSLDKRKLLDDAMAYGQNQLGMNGNAGMFAGGLMMLNRYAQQNAGTEAGTEASNELLNFAARADGRQGFDNHIDPNANQSVVDTGKVKGKANDAQAAVQTGVPGPSDKARELAAGGRPGVDGRIADGQQKIENGDPRANHAEYQNRVATAAAGQQGAFNDKAKDEALNRMVASLENKSPAGVATEAARTALSTATDMTKKGFDILGTTIGAGAAGALGGAEQAYYEFLEHQEKLNPNGITLDENGNAVANIDEKGLHLYENLMEKVQVARDDIANFPEHGQKAMSEEQQSLFSKGKELLEAGLSATPAVMAYQWLVNGDGAATANIEKQWDEAVEAVPEASVARAVASAHPAVMLYQEVANGPGAAAAHLGKRVAEAEEHVPEFKMVSYPIKGALNAIMDNMEERHEEWTQDAREEALGYGLTPEQADLFAAVRMNALSRGLEGIVGGLPLGEQMNDIYQEGMYKEQIEAVGDPRIAQLIMHDAAVGSSTYVSQIGNLNATGEVGNLDPAIPKSPASPPASGGGGPFLEDGGGGPSKPQIDNEVGNLDPAIPKSPASPPASGGGGPFLEDGGGGPSKPQIDNEVGNLGSAIPKSAVRPTSDRGGPSLENRSGASQKPDMKKEVMMPES